VREKPTSVPPFDLLGRHDSGCTTVKAGAEEPLPDPPELPEPPLDELPTVIDTVVLRPPPVYVMLQDPADRGVTTYVCGSEPPGFTADAIVRQFPVAPI
jgi:hypothetical protein